MLFAWPYVFVLNSWFISVMFMGALETSRLQNSDGPMFQANDM